MTDKVSKLAESINKKSDKYSWEYESRKAFVRGSTALLIDLALYKVSLRDKEIFRAIFLDGYTREEVAKTYGITHVRVTKIYHNCLEIVKKDTLVKKMLKDVI